MSEPGYTLPTATVHWRDDQGAATPESTEYADVYWSRTGVLAEKAHVFRDAAGLDARQSGATFTICETGFGFANNFLLTASWWREHGRGRLHYIAVEHRPVSADDLARHLASPGFEQFGDLPRQLLDAYPAPVRGHHVRYLADNICLHLLIDDVDRALIGLRARVDAWYLDGFSPRLNPDMWQDEVFNAMARLSRPGATASTYSVAGVVRRGIAKAGFSVRKTPGIGAKAEMLTAQFTGDWQPAQAVNDRVVIIGAGIAGRSVQAALARRGIDAPMIGRETGAASAMPALSVWPQLTRSPQDRSHFSLAANAFCLQHWPGLHSGHMIYRTADTGKLARMQAIAEQLPDEVAVCLEDEVRFAGGWMQVDCRPDIIADIGSISRENDAWCLRDAEGEPCYRADTVIVAAGLGSADLLPVTLRAIRGQCLAVSGDHSLQRMMTGDISVTPLSDRQLYVGSTYDLDSRDEAPRETETHELLEQLAAACDVAASGVEASTGIRAATRDRLPLVGPVPDWRALADHCGRHPQLPFNEYQPGLYACTGFGSRGATHAPLCGEAIAALVCGDPQPLPSRQLWMLAVERFTIRDGQRRNVNPRQTPGR